jgi:hypothetical protein
MLFFSLIYKYFLENYFLFLMTIFFETSETDFTIDSKSLAFTSLQWETIYGLLAIVGLTLIAMIYTIIGLI